MARIANIPLILLFSIGIMVASVYCDYGNEAWVWFQRSGSVMVLCCAVPFLHTEVFSGWVFKR